jgi:hypothetical protein
MLNTLNREWYGCLFFTPELLTCDVLFYAFFCPLNTKKKSLNVLIFSDLRFFEILLSGPDGTRTRDPMRDRHVF